MLQLTKPLSFFDLETTNRDTQKAKIIEIAIVKLHPDGHRDSLVMVFNPGEPISAEVSSIHGFTDEMVKDKPLFREYAAEIAEFLSGSDLGGFNSNAYDIPVIAAEFARAGVKFSFDGVNFVDAGNLFKLLAPRTLTRAVLDYCERDHHGAHGALADTQATIDVLNAMFTHHPDELPLTVPELALKSNYDKKRLDIAGKFSYNDKNQVVWTFGKNKDKPVTDDFAYLDWMLIAKTPAGDYSFSEDTRDVITNIKRSPDFDRTTGTFRNQSRFKAPLIGTKTS